MDGSEDGCSRSGDTGGRRRSGMRDPARWSSSMEAAAVSCGNRGRERAGEERKENGKGREREARAALACCRRACRRRGSGDRRVQSGGGAWIGVSLSWSGARGAGATRRGPQSPDRGPGGPGAGLAARGDVGAGRRRGSFPLAAGAAGAAAGHTGHAKWRDGGGWRRKLRRGGGRRRRGPQGGRRLAARGFRGGGFGCCQKKWKGGFLL